MIAKKHMTKITVSPPTFAKCKAHEIGIKTHIKFNQLLNKKARIDCQTVGSFRTGISGLNNSVTRRFIPMTTDRWDSVVFRRIGSDVEFLRCAVSVGLVGVAVAVAVGVAVGVTALSTSFSCGIPLDMSFVSSTTGPMVPIRALSLIVTDRRGVDCERRISSRSCPGESCRVPPLAVDVSERVGGGGWGGGGWGVCQWLTMSSIQFSNSMTCRSMLALPTRMSIAKSLLTITFTITFPAKTIVDVSSPSSSTWRGTGGLGAGECGTAGCARGTHLPWKQRWVGVAVEVTSDKSQVEVEVVVC